MATSLKNMKNLLNKLHKAQPIFVRSGFLAIEKIKLNWLKGRGADGNSFSPLSKNYKLKKTKAGKPGYANMNYNGHMSAALISKPYKKFGALITFSSAYEKDKAEGNVSKRSGMMEPSDKLASLVSDYILKEIKL